MVERIEAPGISGALPLEKRPDLQRLAVLAKTKAFDELRVFAVDRLTRADDPRERFAVWGMALDAGAVIVDAHGHVVDPASEMGEIDYYLQTLFSSRERRKIGDRTMAGRRRALAEGRLSQGIPPYGRRLVLGKWELYEPEATTYREIIAMVAAGKSISAVGRELDARGIQPPRGARWATTTIARLVHSESCVGRYRVKGAVQTIPAIVSEEEWRGARMALKRGRTKGGRVPTIPALLRGLVRCAECGRRMWTRSDGEGQSPVYVCPPKRALPVGAKPCRKRVRHKVGEVDEAVIGELRRIAASVRSLRLALAAASEQSDAAALASEVERCRRRVASLEAREAKTLALLDVLSEDAARSRLKAIAAERSEAAEALEAAIARQKAAEAPRVDARALSAELRRMAEACDWSAYLAALVPDNGLSSVEIDADRSITIRGLVRSGNESRPSRWSECDAGTAPRLTVAL